MLLRQACSTLRIGLLRRSMATAGRRPDTPQRMVSLGDTMITLNLTCIKLLLNFDMFLPQTPLHQAVAFTAIFCGVLGPGVLLMLTREKPISEH
ncbi:unnamed protein product [Porites evermanni]|uniref:Uncharacterized protein n=1 Tax=Porites evermanni TaxID=104178 RepID=A0ABN8N874_9CNID|nr:unnamed protein product [Porites evermanni]